MQHTQEVLSRTPEKPQPSPSFASVREAVLEVHVLFLVFNRMQHFETALSFILFVYTIDSFFMFQLFLVSTIPPSSVCTIQSFSQANVAILVHWVGVSSAPTRILFIALLKHF